MLPIPSSKDRVDNCRPLMISLKGVVAGTGCAALQCLDKMQMQTKLKDGHLFKWRLRVKFRPHPFFISQASYSAINAAALMLIFQNLLRHFGKERDAEAMAVAAASKSLVFLSLQRLCAYVPIYSAAGQGRPSLSLQHKIVAGSLSQGAFWFVSYKMANILMLHYPGCGCKSALRQDLQAFICGALGGAIGYKAVHLPLQELARRVGRARVKKTAWQHFVTGTAHRGLKPWFAGSFVHGLPRFFYVGCIYSFLYSIDRRQG